MFGLGFPEFATLLVPLIIIGAIIATPILLVVIIIQNRKNRKNK